MEKSNYSANCRNSPCAIIKSFSNTSLCTSARKCFLSALETCVDALAIYHHTLINYHRDDDINDPISKDEPKTSKNTQIQSDNVEMLRKLGRDSKYVRELLEDVKSEMRERGTHTALIKLIEETGARELEANNVIVKYVEAQKIVEDLRKSLEEEMMGNKNEMEALGRQLTDLREERQKIELKIERETGYTSAWEQAQCEESTQRCNITLERLRTSLEDTLIRKKNESRVAREIEAFLKQNIAFNVHASDTWEERFNREKEMYIERNNRLREDIENRRWALQQHEAKFRERQAFIDQYLAEKEAYRVQRQLEDHKKHSAIAMQAWWRGVMVRRKLGPYRPDEKKKKKPGKGKK